MKSRFLIVFLIVGRRQLQDVKNILASKEEEFEGQRLDFETLREENERLRESLQASLAREKALKASHEEVHERIKRLETSLEEERFLRMRSVLILTPIYQSHSFFFFFFFYSIQ